MKLYFKSGDTKKFIGEPQTEKELIELILDDSDKKFLSLKGKLKFTLKPGSTYALSSGTGEYVLED